MFASALPIMPAEPVVFVINFVWIVFFLFVAAASMRYKVSQITKGKLRLSPLAILPFALLFLGLVLFESGAIDAWSVGDFYYIGAALTAGGFLLYGAARSYIAESWSVPGQIFAARVVTEGPYSHIRHPIYLGMMLMMAGSALMASNMILIVMMPAVAISFYALARNEEQTLELVFSDYAAYKERTKMFVPGVF